MTWHQPTQDSRCRNERRDRRVRRSCGRCVRFRARCRFRSHRTRGFASARRQSQFGFDATLDRRDRDESFVGVRPLGAGGEIQLLATLQRHRVDTRFRQGNACRRGFGRQGAGRRGGRRLAGGVGPGGIVRAERRLGLAVLDGPLIPIDDLSATDLGCRRPQGAYADDANDQHEYGQKQEPPTRRTRHGRDPHRVVWGCRRLQRTALSGAARAELATIQLARCA